MNMRKLLLCVFVSGGFVSGGLFPGGFFPGKAARSQTAAGSIRGTITDPTNAPVPGAKVTAADVDRNVE